MGSYNDYTISYAQANPNSGFQIRNQFFWNFGKSEYFSLLLNTNY